jgi:hypothetical protein
LLPCLATTVESYHNNCSEQQYQQVIWREIVVIKEYDKGSAKGQDQEHSIGKS